MATRTEPMRITPYLLPLSDSIVPALAGRARRPVTLGTTGGLGVRLPLRGDQLVKSADFPLHRLQAVPLQFEGVAVHALPGSRQAGPETLQSFLEPGAPALEDPQPDVRPGLAEEREMHSEPVVFPRRRASLGKQVLQPLLAIGGQPVHDLRPAARERLWRA